MMISRGKTKELRETCSSATTSTTNLTWNQPDEPVSAISQGLAVWAIAQSKPSMKSKLIPRSATEYLLKKELGDMNLTVY
jgi:hypothetical protein